MDPKSNVDKVVYTRAQAAERFLERRRMGIECAVEALEVVGYGVTIDSQGRYKVIPPNGQIPSYVGDGSSAQADPDTFLGEYPHMLTPTHIAEIMGCSVQTVRTLCNDGVLPAVQMGTHRWYVPKPFFIEMLATESGVFE